MCRGAEDERSVMSERAGMIPTAEARSAATSGAAEACLPASDLSPNPSLCSIYLFICVIQSPPWVGRGAAELSGRSRPMRRRSKGARTDRREDGGWVGARIIWIFSSPCLCSFILSAMVQYSVSNMTKCSHTDHFRCSVMLFPYAPFGYVAKCIFLYPVCSIRYSLFILQSAFTQIWLDLEIRLRYYCTAIFQTTKTARRDRTITVTVTPAMNLPCAFFPIS